MISRNIRTILTRPKL